MGKKKKKKNKGRTASLWEKLSQPGVMSQFTDAFKHFYGGSQGMKYNRKTGEYEMPSPIGKPTGATK